MCVLKTQLFGLHCDPHLWNVHAVYSMKYAYGWVLFYPVMVISWASYQIRKIAACASAGNAGNFFPRNRLQRKPLFSDPGMHHGTCVTHVPWCMSGSLTRGDGENVPCIPGTCAPAILRIWQEAHGTFVDACNLFTRILHNKTQQSVISIHMSWFVLYRRDMFCLFYIHFTWIYLQQVGPVIHQSVFDWQCCCLN